MCERLEIHIIAASSANEYLEAEYLPEHNRRFAREASRPENYHVRAPSLAKLREVLRLEMERWISNDGVVQYRGHFLQLKPQNKRYGPTQAKALICEWEDGAVEVRYRGECMDYEDLAIRPPGVQAAAGEARRELAKQVGSKPAQDHPWRQGYEQRMKLAATESITSVITAWGVRLRCALNAPHKPRRRAPLRRTPQGQQQIKRKRDNSNEARKGTFLKRLDSACPAR
jgi:hypothetical protein